MICSSSGQSIPWGRSEYAFHAKFIQNMHKSISMHDKLSLKSRESRLIFFFFFLKTQDMHSEKSTHKMLHADHMLFEQYDPAALMESIINKQCEVLTWCIPVAAGVGIYSGLGWILNDVSHAYSHNCRITSSDLSSNELFSRESCNVFYKSNCRRFYSGKCWPFLQWKSLFKTEEFAYKIGRPILEIWHFDV